MNTLEPTDADAGVPVDISGLRKNFGVKVALADFSLRLELRFALAFWKTNVRG